MTTLKSFQAEIEQISHDKHKQAIQVAKEAHAAAELARHHGKLPSKVTIKETVQEEHTAEEEEIVPLEVSHRYESIGLTVCRT